MLGAASNRLRHRNDGLPMSSGGGYGGGAGLPYGNSEQQQQYSSHPTDGSGRAIRMESPIHRAWRNASRYTKGSYYCLITTILLVVFGFRHLRHHSASIWLTCHAQDCHLQITPPGRKGTTSFKFARSQLAQSQAIKVNENGDFVKLDVGRAHVSRGRHKRNASSSRGPDAEGNYDSYTIVLRPPLPSAEPDENKEDDVPQVDLSPIEAFTYAQANVNGRVLSMRKFNLGQSTRRTRAAVTRIENYIKSRRHKLVVKESARLAWKGILAMVLGLFSFLITLLMGQFVEPPKETWAQAQRRRHKGRLTPKPKQQKSSTYKSAPKSKKLTNKSPYYAKPADYRYPSTTAKYK